MEDIPPPPDVEAALARWVQDRPTLETFFRRLAEALPARDESADAAPGDESLPRPAASRPRPPCKRHAGPSCWTLLDDPAGVLLDRDRWPEDLCPAMLQYSTRQWARALSAFALPYPLIGDSRPPYLLKEHDNWCWANWADIWPLPIGRGTLFLHKSQIGPNAGDADQVYASLPFDGEDEYAVFTVRIPTSEGTLDLFNLCDWALDAPKPKPNVPKDRPYLYGMVAYQVRGRAAPRRDVPAADTQDLLHAARRFFSRFNGRPLRGSPNAGQPSALRGLTVQDLTVLLQPVFEEAKRNTGRWPGKLKACEKLGVRNTAFSDYLRDDLDTNWEALRNDIWRSIK